jgi:hypothetical protein
MEQPGGGQRSDDDGNDERRAEEGVGIEERRAAPTPAGPIAEGRFSFDGRGRPGPEIAWRDWLTIGQRPQLETLSREVGRRLVAVGTRFEMVIEPG